MLFNTRDGFLKRIVATARELTGPTLPQVCGVRVKVRVSSWLVSSCRHTHAPQKRRIDVHMQATPGPCDGNTVLSL